VSVTTFVIPFHYGSSSGTVINYGSDSGPNLLTHYGSGSASQKVMVLTVPVQVLVQSGSGSTTLAGH
jgi:hypothetical protein